MKLLLFIVNAWKNKTPTGKKVNMHINRINTTTNIFFINFNSLILVKCVFVVILFDFIKEFIFEYKAKTKTQKMIWNIEMDIASWRLKRPVVNLYITTSIVSNR